MVRSEYRRLPEIYPVMTINHQPLQTLPSYSLATPGKETHSGWRTADSLHWRCWESEYVVYHPLSGDTHLLGEAAGHILLALQQTPQDTASLSKSLASVMGIKISPEFMMDINNLLTDLHKLALIERGSQ